MEYPSSAKGQCGSPPNPLRRITPHRSRTGIHTFRLPRDESIHASSSNCALSGSLPRRGGHPPAALAPEPVWGQRTRAAWRCRLRWTSPLPRRQGSRMPPKGGVGAYPRRDPLDCIESWSFHVPKSCFPHPLGKSTFCPSGWVCRPIPRQDSVQWPAPRQACHGRPTGDRCLPRLGLNATAPHTLGQPRFDPIWPRVGGALAQLGWKQTQAIPPPPTHRT